MSGAAETQAAKAFHARSLIVGLGVAALIIVLDQVSKNLILGHLLANPGTIVLAPFLNIVMAWNTGVSFGMFNDGTVSPWFFFGLSVLISTGLAVWMARTDARLLIAALAMIIGGAIGNAIDRVRWGAVFDFIDVHAFGWHWPAFNVADAGITVGAALLILDSLFRRAD
ncbi:signal peptidase II [Novispirillum sp. DQ9]|uniref:signal peptidase II n=1 Tax=Novispirillum sp. DQ9 TaxID=3398612 RepID=UPI003C7CFF8B